MDVEEAFQSIAVLGAAGKMGRGIALLLLQEIAFIDEAVLILVETNSTCFSALKKYLRSQLKKFAERHINALREKYEVRLDLIDNEQIIEAFVAQAMDRIRTVISLEECSGATLIFEAIAEDPEIKGEAFRKLSFIASHEACYFTNTSSIPIHVLQEKSALEKKIIGFHFYNPPFVQQLVELIIPENSDPALRELALKIAKRLKKIVVFSKDVAGFIGNGHFIREISEACQLVRELEEIMPLTEAIYTVDYLTREFMLRPMGIFQLIDYVGLDICKRIQEIMTTYLTTGPFTDELIDTMIENGAKGGQSSEGMQKDGIFRYVKGQPIEVYDYKTKSYTAASADKLGPLPPGHVSWKSLSRDVERQSKILNYFKNLWEESTLGAELSRRFLAKSRSIAHLLVDSDIAQSIKDVDIVLQKGFFHLYGVEEPFSSFAIEGKKS